MLITVNCWLYWWYEQTKIWYTTSCTFCKILFCPVIILRSEVEFLNSSIFSFKVYYRFNVLKIIIKNFKLWHIHIMNLHYVISTVPGVAFQYLFQAKFYFLQTPWLMLCNLTFIFPSYCSSFSFGLMCLCFKFCLLLSFIIYDMKMSSSHI